MNVPCSSEYRECRESVHLQKGGLWLKRDKFFSKWRERFFVITSTHLKCFESDSESILLWKVSQSLRSTTSKLNEIPIHTTSYSYITLHITLLIICVADRDI